MVSFWEGKTVWLVGATTGIGRETAQLIAERGARVLASGRSDMALRELVHWADSRGYDVRAVPLDVTDPEGWRQALAAIAGLRVDALIYSAGSWTRTDINRFDADVADDQMAVNYNGLVRAVEAVLPEMIERGQGLLVGLSSASAYVPLPGAEAYGASKAAVVYFLQALRIDLARSGVRVVTVVPGFVRTRLTDKNDFAMPFMMSPTAAARAIADGIESGAAEIHFPKRLTLPMKLAGALPRGAKEWLVRQLLKPGRNDRKEEAET